MTGARCDNFTISSDLLKLYAVSHGTSEDLFLELDSATGDVLTQWQFDHDVHYDLNAFSSTTFSDGVLGLYIQDLVSPTYGIYLYDATLTTDPIAWSATLD